MESPGAISKALVHESCGGAGNVPGSSAPVSSAGGQGSHFEKPRLDWRFHSMPLLLPLITMVTAMTTGSLKTVKKTFALAPLEMRPFGGTFGRGNHRTWKV